MTTRRAMDLFGEFCAWLLIPALLSWPFIALWTSG